jgi:hypothetical protein
VGCAQDESSNDATSRVKIISFVAVFIMFTPPKELM